MEAGSLHYNSGVEKNWAKKLDSAVAAIALQRGLDNFSAEAYALIGKFVTSLKVTNKNSDKTHTYTHIKRLTNKTDMGV